ncbi:MAG: hypothetical protein ACI8ZM_001732, partial [Crocinitomix sp.]
MNEAPLNIAEDSIITKLDSPETEYLDIVELF